MIACYTTGSGRTVAVAVVSLFLIIAFGASADPAPSPFKGSIRSDQEALVTFFHQTGGATLWPSVWRSFWVPQYNASITLCGRHEWHAAQCDPSHRLRKLYHRSGHAAGPLPGCVGDMLALQVLDLSENRLTGTIPRSFGDLENVISIALSGNELNGTLPAELFKLKRLQHLVLSRNKFTGTIPEAIGELTELQTLFLDGNQFAGKVPFAALSKLKNLRHLRLDNNSLEGVVPSDFLKDAPSIVAVELAGNSKLTLDKARPLPEVFGRSHYATIGTKFTQVPGAEGSTRTLAPTVAGADGGVSAPVRFMSIGDHGTGGEWLGTWHEQSCGLHFNRMSHWLDTAFTTSVGDNLYVYKGQHEAEFFRESYERMFTAPPLVNRPWYAVIGNHDHGWPQFAYAAKSKRWKMRESEYRVVGIPIPHRDGSPSGATLDIFLHDTVTKFGHFRKTNWVLLMDWLQQSNATYKIVVTHYPLWSGGCHGLQAGAKALLGVKNLTVVFAGHDHHSEVGLRHGTFHSLTGAFARGPCYTHQNKELEGRRWFDALQAGFSYVTVDPYLLNITFVSEHGAMLFHQPIPFDWHTKAEKEYDHPPSAEDVRRYVAMNRPTPAIRLTGASPAENPDPIFPDHGPRKAASLPTNGTNKTTAGPASAQPAATTAVPQTTASPPSTTTTSAAKIDTTAAPFTTTDAPKRSTTSVVPSTTQPRVTRIVINDEDEHPVPVPSQDGSTHAPQSALVKKDDHAHQRQQHHAAGGTVSSFSARSLFTMVIMVTVPILVAAVFFMELWEPDEGDEAAGDGDRLGAAHTNVLGDDAGEPEDKMILMGKGRPHTMPPV